MPVVAVIEKKTEMRQYIDVPTSSKSNRLDRLTKNETAADVKNQRTCSRRPIRSREFNLNSV